LSFTEIKKIIPALVAVVVKSRNSSFPFATIVVLSAWPYAKGCECSKNFQNKPALSFLMRALTLNVMTTIIANALPKALDRMGNELGRVPLIDMLQSLLGSMPSFNSACQFLDPSDPLESTLRKMSFFLHFILRLGYLSPLKSKKTFQGKAVVVQRQYKSIASTRRVCTGLLNVSLTSYFYNSYPKYSQGTIGRVLYFGVQWWANLPTSEALVSSLMGLNGQLKANKINIAKLVSVLPICWVSSTPGLRMNKLKIWNIFIPLLLSLNKASFYLAATHSTSSFANRR
jgi:hypothetical protein